LPGAIALTVFGISLFGAALRVALDPRLRGLRRRARSLGDAMFNPDAPVRAHSAS